MFGIDKPGLHRFARYAMVGGGTLGLDMLLLFIAVKGFGLWYPPAVMGAFFIAVTVNYTISRRVVFARTQREWYEGYLYFALFAIFLAGLTALLVAELVESFHAPYLWARLAVAAPVGMINYLLNLKFNFMTAGQH